MFRSFSLLVLLLFLTACGDGGNENDLGGVPYVVLSRGLQEGLEGQQIHVVTTDDEYAKLMSESEVFGMLPAPDFDQNQLVAAFSTLNSCYSLSVGSVAESEVSLVVAIQVSGAFEVCLPVVGTNYVLIETSRSPKQVSVVYVK